MASVGTRVGKRAAKATARHTWHGFTSKAQRQPLRSATLLTAGAALGVIVGWVAGRVTARRAEGPPPPPAPPGTASTSPADAPAAEPAPSGQLGPDVDP